MYIFIREKPVYWLNSSLDYRNTFLCSEKTQKSKRALTRLVACVQISCRLSCKFSCPQRGLLLWSLASGQLATPGWLAVNSNRGGNRKAETVTKPLMVAPRPPANTSSSGGRHHTRPAEWRTEISWPALAGVFVKSTWFKPEALDFNEIRWHDHLPVDVL